jgi:ER lumen protein retaining receptor
VESIPCSLDLFWTFTDSLYLTTFKLLFIGSSAYIIYLMLNDYKPTHDPNIDTFKVQYLLGISVILALLFPHDYRLSEVRANAPASNLLPTLRAVASIQDIRLNDI